MLSLFELVAILLGLTATFAWLNEVFVKLPANVALLLMGLIASLLLIAINALLPGSRLYQDVVTGLLQIDLYSALIQGILAFLLFAGAMHVDVSRLRSRAPIIAGLTTLGIFISVAVVGLGMMAGAAVFGTSISLLWAMVFATLITPTDPVGVLSTLKSVKVPSQLETMMSGEALFNDGIAIVLFTVAVHAAAGTKDIGLLGGSGLIVLEAGGGALLGLVTGYLAYRALNVVNEYTVEFMVTLALVMVTYTLAMTLHVSGPISVVVAGLLIGNRAAERAMSDVSRRYIFAFWTLVDDILNAVLFLLIGIEVLVVEFEPNQLPIALVAVPLVIGARFLSVGVPVKLLGRWRPFVKGTVPVLTWGGVRGGISVALALSLPQSEARSVILTATYAVVVFSLVVQGLSLELVIRHAVPEAERQSKKNIQRNNRSDPLEG